MRCIQIDTLNEDIEKAIAYLKVVIKAIPPLKKDEVLIKVAAAPCNPSDLLFLQGRYGVKKKLPAVPGWEGAGTVIANGGSWLGKWLQGKKVAFSSDSNRDGTWAQYCITKSESCIPLKEHLTLDEASMLIINPFTAVGLLEIAKKEKHPAIVQTAAASQVGRMVIKLAEKAKIPCINIVRRSQQAELLKSDVNVVINTEKTDFLETLTKEAKRLKATLALDAISGEMSAKILEGLPNQSKLILYGALSGEASGPFNPLDLIFLDKKVSGFMLTNWFKKSSFLKKLRTIKMVQHLMISGEFKTPIQRHCNLDDFQQGLVQYLKNMTAGKVLLNP